MKHLLLITVVLLAGRAELKGVGRTIGHTTRDVTREIGHGTRDTVNGIGNEIKNK